MLNPIPSKITTSFFLYFRQMDALYILTHAESLPMTKHPTYPCSSLSSNH